MKRIEIDYYGTKVNCVYVDYRDNEGSYTVELLNVLVDNTSIQGLLSENIWDELQQEIYNKLV